MGVRWHAALLLALALLAPAPATRAESVLLPVSDRRAHVFDPSGAVLFVTTSSGAIERYDVKRKRLLEPFAVGLSLNGVDVTSDGGTLYVAEGTRGATRGILRKVDARTGASSLVPYELTSSDEGGAWDVVLGAGGKGLVTARFLGSGSLPLRELDLSLDRLATRTDLPLFFNRLAQDSPLGRGLDRSLLLVGEAGGSRELIVYDAASDSFTTSQRNNLTPSFPTVGPDGSLVAASLGFDTTVFDPALVAVGHLDELRASIFDPVRDVLYAVDAATDETVAIDTNDFAELIRFPIGEDVTTFTQDLNSGELSIADDGSLLALSTPTGVRLFALVGADSDGDGVPDPIDKCPEDANPGQGDGDGDGLGDVCDRFPEEADKTSPPVARTVPEVVRGRKLRHARLARDPAPGCSSAQLG